MAAWHALLNMLRAAARDPLWAVFSLVMSPLRAGRHLVVTMLLYLVAWGVLVTFWHGIKLLLGILKFGFVNTAVMTVINVFMLALLWRLLPCRSFAISVTVPLATRMVLHGLLRRPKPHGLLQPPAF